MLTWSLSLLVGLQALVLSSLPQPECPPESELTVDTYKDGTSLMSCVLKGTQTMHGALWAYRGRQLTQATLYEKGLREGLSRSWDAEGNPTFYGHYHQGEKTGFWVTWHKGKPDFYGHLGGLPRERGPYRHWSWWGNGRLQRVVTYVGKSIKHGREWEFHGNGPLASQADFFENRLTGRLLEWDNWGKFERGTCLVGDEKFSRLWETSDYEEALTRECAPEAKLVGLVPPARDHRIPPPSAATNDLIPPEHKDALKGLQPPVPPPFPVPDITPPKPEVPFDLENPD